MPKELRETPVVIKAHKWNDEDQKYDYIDHDMLSSKESFSVFIWLNSERPEYFLFLMFNADNS